MGCELDATERARGRCTRLPVAHSLARWNAAVSFPLRHGREAGRSACGLSARERSVACGRKLWRSVGNFRRSVGNFGEASETAIRNRGRSSLRQACGAMWPSGAIRRLLREKGTRALVLAQCWLRGAGTRQRRRQCGGRSLCRYIRWTPKAAPTDPKRAPPVCAQLSSVSTRVRHALPRTRVLRRREVQCGGRPEDNG